MIDLARKDGPIRQALSVDDETKPSWRHELIIIIWPLWAVKKRRPSIAADQGSKDMRSGASRRKIYMAKRPNLRCHVRLKRLARLGKNREMKN